MGVLRKIWIETLPLVRNMGYNGPDAGRWESPADLAKLLGV